MKTLKWSSIALLFLCIYSSCTKSANNFTETTMAAKTGISGSQINDDVPPALKITFNPSPAIQNQTVTVTGIFDASTGTAIPDCGKLELQQKIDGQWVTVAGPQDVTFSSHEVAYQFTPTVAGEAVYEFRVHYIVAGCKGFDNAFSGSHFLDVLSACQGLTLTGKVTNAHDQGDGTYLFTVQYTVNTCGITYTHLKTQGGLTAWASDVTDLTAGAVTWPAGNSSHPNTIIKWEEDAPLPGDTKTYSISFRKTWSGSGPIELTGAWSVTASNNGVEVKRVDFDSIVYP